MTESRVAPCRRAIQDAVWPDEYDGYYYDLRGARALPVLRVRYADAMPRGCTLDPERGGVVQRSGRSAGFVAGCTKGFQASIFRFCTSARPLWDIASWC